MARNLRRMALAVTLLASLAACGATFQNHGYVPDDRDLQKLRPGIDTHETVETIIGRPATSGIERDDAWYYVQTRERTLGPLAPRTMRRQLVAVSFAPNGTVSNIERFGLERGRVVSLSRRVTRTSIRDFGLIQQIFANFGRINIGDTLADEI